MPACWKRNSARAQPRSSLSALVVTHRAQTGGISDVWRDSPIPSRSDGCCRDYSRMRSAAGGVYSRAPEFLAELDHKLKLDKLQTMESRNHRAGHIEDIKPLKMFHAD